MTADRVIQHFNARKQIVLSQLEKDDEVRQRKFSEDDDSDDDGDSGRDNGGDGSSFNKTPLANKFVQHSSVLLESVCVCVYLLNSYHFLMLIVFCYILLNPSNKLFNKLFK